MHSTRTSHSPSPSPLGDTQDPRLAILLHSFTILHIILHFFILLHMPPGSFRLINTPSGPSNTPLMFYKVLQSPTGCPKITCPGNSESLVSYFSLLFILFICVILFLLVSLFVCLFFMISTYFYVEIQFIV